MDNGNVMFGCEKRYTFYSTNAVHTNWYITKHVVSDNSDSSMVNDDIILNVLKTQACLPDLVERVGGLNGSTNWSNLLSHDNNE